MALDSFRLDGRTALVTGASSGLGRHFAQVLAAAGATVILAARRRERLEALAQEIADAGGTAHCVDLDVADSASVDRAFAEIDELGTGLDIVVNNAGIARGGFAAELSEADWDAVIDTNLKGVFLVAKAATRRMIERGKGGSIVNIASVLGYRVAKALSPYIAAKSAVVKFTQALALENCRYGIRVNSIAPGYFSTEINQGFLETEAGQKNIRQVPMRRAGKYEELSGALLLLASDAGSYMTGSNITVDGGHLCSSL